MSKKLNLGSGDRPKKGYLNLDIIGSSKVDIKCDILLGLPFDRYTIDKVYSEDFLEHIPQDKVIFIINEIWRVLKVGGTMEHYIPNAGSINDFASPTHLSHWNLRTFEFFEDNNRRRNLDKEFSGIKAKFKKILTEEVNIQDGIAQSIHIIYQKVN